MKHLPLQEASSSSEAKEEQSHIIAQSSQTLAGQPQNVFRRVPKNSPCISVYCRKTLVHALQLTRHHSSSGVWDCVA